MSVIVLPLIPDAEIETLAGLEPRRVWLFAVILAAVSYAGYIAVRLFGTSRGRAVAGAAAGLASSTAVAVGNARLSAKAEESAALAAGTLVAGAVSFLRTLAIVWVMASAVGWILLPAILAGTAVQLAAAFFLLRRADADGTEPALPRNPFELRAVLQLAALIAVVWVLGRLAADHVGEGGTSLVAALSGLADVDAVALTMTGLVPDPLSEAAAARAVAIALASNTLAKSAYAVVLGTRRYGVSVAAASALALGLGGAVFAATGLR
jgi:uncharacterized membrane protein (DUF4010 family)